MPNYLVTIKCDQSNVFRIDSTSIRTSDGTNNPTAVSAQQVGSNTLLICNTPDRRDPTVATQLALTFLREVDGTFHAYNSTQGDAICASLDLLFMFHVGYDIGGQTYNINFVLGLVAGNNPTWWIGSRNLVYSSELQCGLLPIPSNDGTLRQVFKLYYEDLKNTLYFSAMMSPLRQIRLYPNWMTTLPANLPITSVNLPGTHDSAAIQRGSRIDAWECQLITITDQLNAGVRLLDIRIQVEVIDASTFALNTCHGPLLHQLGYNRFQSLSSALDEIQSFLSTNASEFVVVSLKIDNVVRPFYPRVPESAWIQAIKDLLQGYPVYRFRSVLAGMPTVGEARGYMFLLNRLDHSPDFGLPLLLADNTTTQGRYNTSIGGLIYYYQDRYNYGASAVKSAQREKAEIFSETIEKFNPPNINTSPVFIYNFASGYVAFSTTTSVSMPNNQALILTATTRKLVINKKILKWLGAKNSALRPQILGWSLFDFVNLSYVTDLYGGMNVIELIIDSNFGYVKYPNAFRIEKNS